MQAIEFTVEMPKDGVVFLPADVLAQLPLSGPVRVLILSPEARVLPTEIEEAETWRRFSYNQFLRDDDPRDAAYEDLVR